MRSGGYSIYFRHAATDWGQNDRIEAPGDSASCESDQMRQLSEAVIHRAQGVLSEPPPSGTNVIIVGHGNLMRAATGAYTGEGGSAVYAPRPESEDGFELVAQLAPEGWTQLADRLGGSD